MHLNVVIRIQLSYIHKYSRLIICWLTSRLEALWSQHVCTKLITYTNSPLTANAQNRKNSGLAALFRAACSEKVDSSAF